MGGVSRPAARGDIRTVQELLGHQSITTTMRYAHYAPQHATPRIREVQGREGESFVFAQEKNRRQDSEGKKNAISGGNLLIGLMPKRGLEPPPPCED